MCKVRYTIKHNTWWWYSTSPFNNEAINIFTRAWTFATIVKYTLEKGNQQTIYTYTYVKIKEKLLRHETVAIVNVLVLFKKITEKTAAVNSSNSF